MTDRPILFSDPMVRALLDGSKTQTRRIVKPWSSKPSNAAVPADVAYLPDFTCYRSTCPYGQPGDRLWVRETFFAYGRWETRYSEKKGRDEWHFVDMTLECDRAYQYAADNPDVPLAKGRGPLPGWHKRPAIFMPRAASRAAPEIVSVRVERLSDCSNGDAIAEGVALLNGRFTFNGGMHESRVAIDAYRTLWESINGAGSWDANPWVWVIEFKRVMP
jgi:hypothetical protein